MVDCCVFVVGVVAFDNGTTEAAQWLPWSLCDFSSNDDEKMAVFHGSWPRVAVAECSLVTLVGHGGNSLYSSTKSIG